jgi:hypothetical protein
MRIKVIENFQYFNHIDFNYADQLGKGIEELNLEINSNYKELQELLPKHFELSLLYGIYKKFLRNDEEEGNSIISQYWEKILMTYILEP